MLYPLIISRSHFIGNSTGGQIERHFINNLDKSIYKPTIVSTNRGDKLLMNQCPYQYYLVPEKFSLKIPAAILRRIGLGGLTSVPDVDYYTWGIATKKFIYKNVDLNKYSYMHTISYPCANQIVALDIKKKTGLPWIAHLYDPWYDNPYRKKRSQFLRNIDKKMEREIAENADLILHVNDVVYNIWIKRYGNLVKDKMYVLPLILNTSIAPVIKEKNNDSLIISHIGNFVLNRTSETFINAVNELVCKYPEFKHKLKVNYIGMVTQREKDLISHYNLHSIFNLVGSIKEEECVKYYEQTDLFLAIDGKNTENIFFPSKIMKYFYYQKPILGITPSNSVLTSELEKSRHTAIDNDCINEIMDYLYKALTNYKELLDFDKDYWKRHSLLDVYKQYSVLVSKIINK